MRTKSARVVDAATAWHGQLHGVVHCAGGSETIGPITQVDSEAWRRTVDLNVNGSMYVLKHAAREMVRGGGGSFVGHLVDRGEQHPPLVRGLRVRPNPRWIICDVGRRRARPVVGAGQLHPARPHPHRYGCAVLNSPEISEDYRVCTPLPRVGEVADIANLAVFLLSRRGRAGHRPDDQRRRWARAAARTRHVVDVRTALRRRRATRGASLTSPVPAPPASRTARRRSPTSPGARRRWRAASGSDRAAGWRSAAAPAVSSPAASTRRMSLRPSAAANPAGSNSWRATSPP